MTFLSDPIIGMGSLGWSHITRIYFYSCLPDFSGDISMNKKKKGNFFNVFESMTRVLAFY